MTQTLVSTDDGQDWKRVLPVWVVLHFDRMAGASPKKAWRDQFHRMSRLGDAVYVSFSDGDEFWGITVIKARGNNGD